MSSAVQSNPLITNSDITKIMIRIKNLFGIEN